jgi:aerobic C4-dicarboxylate transport protein
MSLRSRASSTFRDVVPSDPELRATKARSRAGKLFGHLYLQVIAGLVVGILIGTLRPSWGEALKPLGDGFLKLIRMLLAPIIFGTIVVGVAKMGTLKEVGRVGVKALLYFEVVSTLALVIGLVVVNVTRPGAGMNIDAATLDPQAIAAYASSAKPQTGVAFFLDIIPSSVVDALAKGHMLQVIFFALLFGMGLANLPNRGKVVVDLLDDVLGGLFGIVRMVMRLAPLGTLGAMAFTVGKYGFGTLVSFGRLVGAVYLTSIFFVVVVLGAIARLNGFSLWRFLRYIKDEILIVFATSSTEVVLPRMMMKLERLGCSRPLVGMVLPVGYTFNADGTAIYLTMAAIFVAQATNTALSLGDQLVVLGVLLLTSKGSAGVAGAGFVTLAATLSSLDKIPVAAMVLLLGIDRFINEARAVTNLIGNGVATIVVARWEGQFDEQRAALVLAGKD